MVTYSVSITLDRSKLLSFSTSYFWNCSVRVYNCEKWLFSKHPRCYASTVCDVKTIVGKENNQIHGSVLNHPFTPVSPKLETQRG